MNDPRMDELRQLLPQAMLPDWVRLGARTVRLFRDRHHPDKHEALLNRLLEQVRESVALRTRRAQNLPSIECPPDLPITARKDEIIEAIRHNQVVVIAGETGSGKTTQIPKMCLAAGLGIKAKIACTQPRRVAALSISRRIAEELNLAWGREVGCKIRFDDRSSPETYIKLMTDGILLAETQGDPDLSEYDAIIIDEAHERSLNIDFLLGYLKSLLPRRKDLKLIVTSATIDTQAFSRHFDNAPIIEVSGRLHPVEVVYQPFDAASEERGDITYVDAAVQACERILYETNFGDVLIFMPGERDIREVGDQLTGRFAGDAEIIPLFGRLSSGDQQRVFSPSPQRKIVIATNIAETSLTIPGIRYVIDSGLARLSRYNSRTRTRRLPVEPVSQSSANQRKGRAGRVEAGVCVRLYSEEDFNARQPFTQPEIQRANLAEVILRMKAFRLGEMESFPFVQPPSPAAIANGYALLQELGALDGERELTPLGQDLARLPIDPTLGRMLLQSQKEHATRELLIIASGLSIQDPRERPLDQKDAAAAAHKKFNDPQSDFLTLLNIWNAVHDQWETLRTQGQRRKFCRQHFLSYLRMREWQDLHGQLHGALEDLGTLKLNESNAAYEAIHRSILAGLLGHVARREERNSYKASGNRLTTIFPGSALYERGEPPKKQLNKPAQALPKPRTNQPQWVVAGEIVETSQLFARTVAGIDPQWIFQIAPHCCKVTYVNPHWSAAAGRVLVEEIVTLHGLEVQRRKAAYGNVNPKDATAIFIRSALVEGDLFPPRQRRSGEAEAEARIAERGTRNLTQQLLAEADAAPADRVESRTSYPFLAHNRAIRQKIENWQTRVRGHDVGDLDQSLCNFYARHLENVSSLHDLNRVLRDQKEPGFLCVTEADLIDDKQLSYDAQAFPDAVPLGGKSLPLRYAYAPGEDWDGVTVELPVELARTLSPAELAWSVPGLRAEQITELLRSLPKSIRRELMPLPEKVAEIVRDLKPSGHSLTEDLGRFLHQRYQLVVPLSAWPADAVPAHLQPRIEIVDHQRKTLAAGRDLTQVKSQLQTAPAKPAGVSNAWRRALQQWERPAVSGWTFGDLPETISIPDAPNLPISAWPGLQVEDGNVSVRLFRNPEQARDASLTGVRRLIELTLQKDFAWLQKDLRGLNKFAPLYAPLGSEDELQDSAFEHLKRHALPSTPLPALTLRAFEVAVMETRERLRGLGQPLIDRVGPLLQLRQQIATRLGASAVPTKNRPKTLSDLSQLGQVTAPKSASPCAAELAALLPPRFLETIPFDRLTHYQRYLKALLTRVERASLNPVKDQERAKLLAPYQEALKRHLAQPPKSAEGIRTLEEFRWLVEEYKVSVFAQELGTAVPVSPKRLDQQLERLQMCG